MLEKKKNNKMEVSEGAAVCFSEGLPPKITHTSSIKTQTDGRLRSRYLVFVCSSFL